MYHKTAVRPEIASNHDFMISTQLSMTRGFRQGETVKQLASSRRLIKTLKIKRKNNSNGSAERVE